MSITVSTDVFCDGEDCGQWTNGATGVRIRARAARKKAARYGWLITRKGDFCHLCRPDKREQVCEA